MDETTLPLPPDHRLEASTEPAHGAAPGYDVAPPAEVEHDLALRMLYDEQTRLRGEIDEMRKKQEEAGKKGEGGDEKKDENKEGGEDDKEGGDKEGDEDKKPPLKERLAEDGEKTKGWIHQHIFATIGIVAASILLIIGCALLLHYLNSYEDTDDAFVDGHTDPISFRISGIVSAVFVEDTYMVKKGQLLIELDARDNQVAKEQASANYAQAQAGVRAQAPNVPITSVNQGSQVNQADFNVVGAQANVSASEERYHSAVADLQQAEANEANAAREEERYRLLVVKQEVTREQYDQHATDAQAQTAVAASRRETAAAAERAVVQAESQLGQAIVQAKQAKAVTPRQIQEQREMLAQRKAAGLVAKAQADQSQLNLEYTRIYAPEDGIIGDKQVQVATQVAPGQELFALTQTNDIWITANFKETEITRMHAGQSVTVYVDALKQKFEGYVEALPGASGAVYSLLPPENATGNYVKVVQRLPVRIRLNPGQNGYQRLRPGMSVEPKVWLR